MPGDLCTAPRIISLAPLSLATVGASGHWLGTRTGAGGTATLAYGNSFLTAAHGSMNNRSSCNVPRLSGAEIEYGSHFRLYLLYSGAPKMPNWQCESALETHTYLHYFPRQKL